MTDLTNMFEPWMRRKTRKTVIDRALALVDGVPNWTLLVLAALVVALFVWLFLEPTHAEAQSGYSATSTPRLVQSAIDFCAQARADWEGEEMPKVLAKTCGV